MVQGRKKDLKRWRLMAQLRSQGLTLAEIGHRLGVTRQNVHRLLGQSRRQSVPCSACGTAIACAGAIPFHLKAVVCLACVGKLPNATLRQRVRTLRLTAGMTRLQLAKRAGVDLSTVKAAEFGRHVPCATTVKRLAKALGVTVAVLTGEESLRQTPERNGKSGKRR